MSSNKCIDKYIQITQPIIICPVLTTNKWDIALHFSETIIIFLGIRDWCLSMFYITVKWGGSWRGGSKLVETRFSINNTLVQIFGPEHCMRRSWRVHLVSVWYYSPAICPWCRAKKKNCQSWDQIGSNEGDRQVRSHSHTAAIAIIDLCVWTKQFVIFVGR